MKAFPELIENSDSHACGKRKLEFECWDMTNASCNWMTAAYCDPLEHATYGERDCADILKTTGMVNEEIIVKMTLPIFKIIA